MALAFLQPNRNLAPLGFRIWWVKETAVMRGSHTHSDIEVNFLREGKVSYLHGGGIASVEPHRFTVLWGGVPHCTLGPARLHEGIWMTIPLEMFLRWELPHRLVARLFGGGVIAARRNEIDGLLLERWRHDFESGHDGRRRALLLEIEARFQRLAEEAGRGATSTGDATGLPHMERVIDYIARHFEEPLTVETIADAVGLHAKYLMRLFRRHSRMSVWEYVTRMRLAHAQQLLLTTNRKIIDVALESGFGSLGPFYRAFAAYSPKKPLAYRRQTFTLNVSPGRRSKMKAASHSARASRSRR